MDKELIQIEKNELIETIGQLMAEYTVDEYRDYTGSVQSAIHSIIDDSIGINALQAKATFGAIGIGTTQPQSAFDCRYAGRDATEGDANRMYFYPPFVNNTQEGNLTGMEEGAIVYNTQASKLRFYKGSAWADV